MKWFVKHFLRIWIVITLIIACIYVILNPGIAYDYLGTFIAFFLISKVLFMFTPKVKKVMFLYTLPLSFIAVSFFLRTHLFPEMMFLAVNRLLLLVFLLADKYLNIKFNKVINTILLNIIVFFVSAELVLNLLFAVTGMDILKRQSELFRLQPSTAFSKTIFNNAEVNTKGYFGMEPDAPKKAERWVFIGDSFGVGVVDYQYNFIQMCSDSLGIETVNLSQPGFSTYDYVKQTRDYIEKAQGDLIVIVLFTGNDINERYISENNWAFKNLKLYCLVRNIIALGASKDVSDDNAAFDMGDSLFIQIETRRAQINDKKMYVSEWGIFEKNINDIKNICKEHNKQLLVLMIPDEFTINTSLQKAIEKRSDTVFDWLEGHNRAKGVLSQLSIDFIDTYPVLDSLNNEGVNPYRANNTHINEAGNYALFNLLRKYYMENRQF